MVVLERETAGFGASGRNGGWCSALFPAGEAKLTRRHGRDAALAMGAAMRDTVDEVGKAVAEEAIACDWVKGGTVALARTPVQLRRARAEDRFLSAREASALVGASKVLGASFTPDCARIQPARLARGLARAVERRGATIYERTTAQTVGPRRVVTDRGVVTARSVVRATEAWSAQLAPRSVVPVYSLIVATRPLPPAFWDAAGLAGGQTFTDHRHLIVYGQRTADDRLVFGGRGAPYHWRSRIAPAFDRDDRVFTGLRAAARDLFPALVETDFTHAWGGPLGIARDWHASVGLGPDGLGWGGGYVGDGVGTSHLAGPHAGCPRPRPPRPGHPPALGRAPLTPVGARAAALAPGQRGPAPDDAGRRGGAPDPAPQPHRGHPLPRPQRLTPHGFSPGGTPGRPGGRACPSGPSAACPRSPS